MRRTPLWMAAIAVIAVTIWLLNLPPGSTTAPVPEPESPAVQNSRSSPETALAGLHSGTAAQWKGAQDTAPSSAPLTSAVDSDIPPYGDHPAEVIVEIGLPIDVDNPPVETTDTPGQVVTLGPLLDADDPDSTMQNSSTELISIGEDMPVE